MTPRPHGRARQDGSDRASPGRVVAVIVTYNRADELVRCLESVEDQSHPVARIVVVDNASTDTTASLLAARSRPGLEVVRLPQNAGAAGGFAAGVRTAREDAAAEWIWLMDDDARPRPDCLERALGSGPASDPGVAALAPTVRGADHRIQVTHRNRFSRARLRPLADAAYRPGTYPAMDHASFVGLLVRAAVARAVAPPKEELFIWADDLEYSLRLRRAGELRLVPEAEVVHYDPPAPVNRRSRAIERLTGLRLVPAPWQGFWRNLCGIRNYCWIVRHYDRDSRLVLAGLVTALAVKSLLVDDHALRRLPLIWRYARMGWEGRFERLDAERWAARTR